MAENGAPQWNARIIRTDSLRKNSIISELYFGFYESLASVIFAYFQKKTIKKSPARIAAGDLSGLPFLFAGTG
ncbi:hypothetical protein CWS43_01580 [Rahnella sp. AA]|uniref:hypothetical protein n=1 Tax=Rahnella sp. AA TaxID=2057180 RepID=UPI000C340094|nr:hypothetical protein [Rahnella sp. AA]PKE32621.1 hypothetical protein CWS43_01580 [Rahnella sp. AA]